MTLLATPAPRPKLPPLCVFQRAMEFGRGVFMMGVVNITPDSFSDGGHFLEHSSAIEHGLSLWEAGADILDIGGESTRPGADPVSVSEEIARVVPVIKALSCRCDAWISVDTYKAEVARAAVDAGAHLVNDISGLGFDDEMASTVADLECGLILMHIRKTPKTMQRDISYDDLIGEISSYFKTRIRQAVDAGVEPSRIILDPGIGFGKTRAQNYQLLRELATFTDHGHPLLIGTSRKSFIGAVVNRPATERVWGTAATVACGIFAGADIVRVHDVQEMSDVVRVSEAICAFPQTDNAQDGATQDPLGEQNSTVDEAERI